MTKLDDYKKMLSLNYEEAVFYLLGKYGPATVSYFNESAYQKLLDDEIDYIRKKNEITRTGEGLYCHHIKEDRALNLSSLSYILRFKYPYSYQEKEELVYCDLIEHTILHALIAKETNNKFGYPGYHVYLRKNVEEWYILKKKPEKTWQLNCYHKAFLSKKEAKEILKLMNDIVYN